MSKYIVGATADIGVDRESQEDFIAYAELDDNNLLCIIADGTGSRENMPQPASIVVTDIIDNMKELWKEKDNEVFEDPCFYMKFCMNAANKILGAFKLGNEEIYSGYAASITCCFLTEDNHIFVSHSGNTRAYILREGRLNQLTRDMTEGMRLVDEGLITIEEYHVHSDRLKILDGLGMALHPDIQSYSGLLRENDIIVLTTDGIHYAIQPEALATIVLESQDCYNASVNLIEASKNIVKYPDNMSAMIICENPEP